MEGTESTPKPRDARTVEALLKSMGVESYDPRVVNQLLELLYRYVSSVLTESRAYSEHAEKSTIDLDDIRLAIRSKCSFTFTQPPPREVTMRLAAERNVVPLPPVDQRAGVALPPPEFQLTAQNYRVVVEKKRQNERTPQSSPKRPRLSSSPMRPSPGGIKTPEKSPGSAKTPVSRSAASPRQMNIDSPLRQKAQGGRISPAAQNSLPVNADANLSPNATKSPQKALPAIISGTPKKQTPGLHASPKAKSPVPDIIMVDAAPKAAGSRIGILDEIKGTGAPTNPPLTLGSSNKAISPPGTNLPS